MGFRKRSIEVKEAGCFKQSKRNNDQIVDGKESSRAFNESKVTERALSNSKGVRYLLTPFMRIGQSPWVFPQHHLHESLGMAE